MTSDPLPRQALLRGLMRRCPRCGRGRLFAGYLQRQARCTDCGESFAGLDADDGPAWLTIGMTVPVVSLLMIALEREAALPLFAEAALLVGVAIACVLTLLPRAKGFFIAALWVIAQKRA